MKFKLSKLNSRGFSHHLLAAVIVVGAAVGGTYYLVASHADPVSVSSPQLLFMNENSKTGTDLYSSTASGPASLLIGKITSFGDNYQASYANNGSSVYYLNGHSKGNSTATLNLFNTATHSSSVVTTLSTDPATEYFDLKWSEAAQKLLLLRADESGYELSTILPDGSNQQTIFSTDGHTVVDNDYWSPDGTHVAILLSSPLDENGVTSNTIVVNADGSDPTGIGGGCTDANNSSTGVREAGDTIISWTPDSSNVVCTDAAGVSKVALSGTSSQMLYANPAKAQTTNAMLSPDGTKLAITTASTSSTASCKVYVLTLSRSKSKLIDSVPNNTCYHITWSPDSSTIAYDTHPDSSTGSYPTVRTAKATGANNTTVFTSKLNYGGYLNNLLWNVQ